MNLLCLADFCNRHRGCTGHIVGRGPTHFDYQNLEEIEGPVLFVNDAVAMEKHLHQEQPSYFFALDKKMKVWLSKIRSIAVLPVNHKGRRGRPKILDGPDDPVLANAGDVILWKTRVINRGKILRVNREKVARLGQLYVGLGTIYSAIHFAWFTGCSCIKFVGCDGINNPAIAREHGDPRTGYDTRLPNFSRTRPWWRYSNIKRKQDEICQRLGLRTEYLGTPSL